FLFPADFAKIYDVATGNINGAGQTIAVIGMANVNPADITNFQSLAGLPQLAPTVFTPTGATPPSSPQTAPPTGGGRVSKTQGEATLDVRRAGSVAPGATILLVVDANGIDIPMEYVIDTNPVPAKIMTISFGACEGSVNQATANSLNSLFSSAA